MIIKLLFDEKDLDCMNELNKIAKPVEIRIDTSLLNISMTPLAMLDGDEKRY